MAVGKKRGDSYPVYVYNAALKKKEYVGSRPNVREANALFRLESERVARRPHASRVTVDEFAANWVDAYPRAEQTNKHNAERVSKFARDFAGRPMDSITRPEARKWALANRGRVSAVRAMFNDALEDELLAANPFLKLGQKQSKGGKIHSPVTEDELHRLADLAITVHGDVWGPTFRTMILVAAYTGMRAGEVFALRWEDINGDTISVRRQFVSKLGKETTPKHGSSGDIFLPPPARLALDEMPHDMTGGLVFHTLYGRQFRQPSLHYAWNPVRVAFGRPDLKWHGLRHFCATYMLNVLGLQPWVVAQQLRHDDGGTLVVELYGHPDAKVARDHIRQAFTDANRPRVVTDSEATRDAREAQGA